MVHSSWLRCAGSHELGALLSRSVLLGIGSGLRGFAYHCPVFLHRSCDRLGMSGFRASVVWPSAAFVVLGMDRDQVFLLGPKKITPASVSDTKSSADTS